MKADDAAATARAAIEADVIAAEAGRQSGREQELVVEPRDLEKHRAGALVPVQGEVAVHLLHAGRARLDRGHRAGRGSRLRAAASAIGLREKRLRSMSRQHEDHEREYDAKC